MITALAVPLFPLETEEDCCCGDACLCDSGGQMSCEMEITTCEQIPLLPIPAAPLNKVVVEKLDTQNREPVIHAELVEDQDSYLVQVFATPNDPPPGYHLPLLI